MQLDCFYLNSLVIKSKAIEQDSEFVEYGRNASIAFHVEKAVDAQKYRVVLNVDVKPGNPSEDHLENLTIELTGFFSFEKEMEKEEIDKYVPTLCLTNLLGIARGIIVQSTGMCHGGPILLPLVNINQVVKEYIQRGVSDKMGKPETD